MYRFRSIIENCNDLHLLKERVDLGTSFANFLCIEGMQIDEYVYESNLSKVFTFVLANHLNPIPAYSYMNIHFQELIQSCAGSPFWTDEEEKNLAVFIVNHGNIGRIAWTSQMILINDSMLLEQPYLSDIKNLIDKLECHLSEKFQLENPQIVITFENAFMRPQNINIQPNSTTEFDSVDKLDYLEYSYKKAMIY
jgi:hypothetical protein